MKRSGKKKKPYTFEELQAFFLEVWKEREDEHGCVRCYESGKLLCGDQKYNISNFHHILYKSSYPQYTFNKNNIVILDQNLHYQAHQDLEKMPKTKKLTQETFKKHVDNTL